MKYPSKKAFLTTASFVICLLVVAIILGIRSAHELKKVAIDQFNHQQLILARQASQEIEGSFNAMIEELVTLRDIYSTTGNFSDKLLEGIFYPVSYTHLRAHET